jgi:PAS domain S-box-containing protein
MCSRLLVVLALVIGGGVFAQPRASPESETKRVLVLYGERGDLPAIRAVAESLREVFHASVSPPIEVLPEYCDFARFPPGKHGDNLLRYLQERYREQQIDMIMPVAGFALEFVLQNRAELFPNTPIVFCASDQREVRQLQLPPDATGVVARFDLEGTFALIQQLQPDAPEILIVHGRAGFDLRWAEQTREIVEKNPALKSRVRWYGDGTLAETVTECRRLSPKSSVLLVSMLEDSSGRTMSGLDVARDLARESAAPVYGQSVHWLPAGVLGGAMYDFGENARQTAELAVKVLQGGWVPYNPDTPLSRSPVRVNWEAMKKWNIPESRLPAGAVVHNRKPTFWEVNRTFVISVSIVVVVQGALIAGLLVNRATRRRAERALAESKERMGLAAEAANLGMWVWDVAGDDAWMTEQGRALFGFKADARIDNSAVLDRVHPADRPAREAALKRALATNGDYELEYRVQTPEGGERWISARGRCVGTANGHGPKLLGVSMDVTARKRAELEAAQQRAELSHLTRVALVGEMATSLAHELNQPLTAMVTNANAAQRFIAHGTMDPAELRELLGDIAADGRRAGDVIRGIKGMVRKIESERQGVDLKEVIADVLRLVRADALAHRCHLVTELQATLPPVFGDSVQLKQVLLNLIINAFDAMRNTPSASCRVEIASRSTAGNMIEVSVRDFGAGLPADGSARIFDRFFSTKREGMGMGLAIARSIIEDHGGTLAGESVNGGGARFWFRLPPHVTTEACHLDERDD